MSILISSSLVRDFSSFIDYPVHVPEVLHYQVFKMCSKLELSVKYVCSEIFVRWRLVGNCPSEAFYPGRDLLASELRDRISYSILVYVACCVVQLVVLLLQYLELVLIAGFVEDNYVFDEECLVWKLH